uniref:Zinc transporter 2-like n=1 Tax=Biomphalaria glabrata TaxID=6526 RepID=A0A2C9KC23_BIOGL
MSSFEGHYHSSVTADIAAGYSIQANDSEDDDLLSKTPTEHRKRSDILSEEDDLWQTPAEAFVQPSVGFLEKSKILKRQLYGEISIPNHHSHSLSEADLNSSRVRSSSGNEPSTGYGSMSENCVTPTWSNRTLHRRSRCSVTPRPYEREFSSSEGEASELTDSHCHSQLKKSGFDKKARTKLIIASILCLVFMTGEMVGGLLAHSLAIISDAAHLLTDFASFMISLMALYLAHRPATKKLSFGWYRIEILGAFVSILMLWVLTGILVYSAVQRIIDDTYEINATIMLITAGTGVFFNIVLGTTLHQHSHSHGGGGHSHGGGGHSHGGEGHSHGGRDSHSNGVHGSVGHSHGTENHSHGTENGDRPQSDSHNGIHGHDNLAAQSEDSPEVFQGPVPSQTSAAPHENKNYGSIDVEKGEHINVAGNEKSQLIKNQEQKHHSRESNINVKAAFIHVIGDLLQSVGVLVAAFIIYYKPEWKIADPICTFMFSLFVLVTTLTIMKDIIVVLMEGTPRGINFAEVRQAFFQVEGVLDIHNLRVWSLTMDKIALSVHLAIDKKSDPHKVLKLASFAIQQKFNISETTMQVEQYVDEMLDCQDCQGPKL